MSGVAPAPVARFRGDVQRVLARAIVPDAPLALAVSGGPDSMALLALAAAAFPGAVIAATVDHRLRADAAAEAAIVGDWCARGGIPHAVLVVETAIGRRAVHEQARALRYALLARWAIGAGAVALATAHHADDQAETFLMRAVRGSGPAGLAGIRAHRMLEVGDVDAGSPRGSLALIRPLLDWWRAELRTLAEAAALPFVDDPSNADPAFERSRVRQMLAATPWLDPVGLARAAAHAGEAHAALDAVTDWLLASRKAPPAGAGQQEYQDWLDFADLPRELRRRLARAAIRSIRLIHGITPAFDLATNIEPLLDAVEQGRAATQAGVLVSRSGSVWHFRPAPLRRTPPRGTPPRRAPPLRSA